MPRLHWAKGIFQLIRRTISGLLFDTDLEGKNGTCQTTADNIGEYEWRVMNEKAVNQPSALSREHHGVHGQAYVFYLLISKNFPGLWNERSSG